MNFYVSDTHALFWYLIKFAGARGKCACRFDEADAGQALNYIPAIVIAELYYLNEKKGRPVGMSKSISSSPQMPVLAAIASNLTKVKSHAALRSIRNPSDGDLY
ncbi:MAG: hypothetical protein M3Q91_16605 [Acidobacteriota bacterium]|nr:hypothetical protein [Acidobacteriota bacterium]